MTNRTITFQTMELADNGTLCDASYAFLEDELGWSIQRDGEDFLKLEAGYTAVKAQLCGVCSTDLARHHLPFPLPQITGHEVVVEHGDHLAVVDINASHEARGLETADCPFCRNDLPSHCPERITLGIDRLPGGFAPYLLAPEKALHQVPSHVSAEAASLTEPLAAAFQALEVTRPQVNDRVAVLGPRRLGMLLLSTLESWRRDRGGSIELVAIARHEKPLQIAKALGVDHCYNTACGDVIPEQDIVFDTTGHPDGLKLALETARRVVHLKSTHGRSVMGMARLSEMVIDEIALMPFNVQRMNFHWPGVCWENCHVYVSPSVDLGDLPEGAYHYHQMPVEEALHYMNGQENLSDWRLPRFDLAIVANVEEADRVIRPSETCNHALVRPQGAILLRGEPCTELGNHLHRRDLELHTSRCGPFPKALDMLAQHPDLAEMLVEHMITHTFPLRELRKAFEVAADSRASIKVVVDLVG